MGSELTVGLAFSVGFFFVRYLVPQMPKPVAGSGVIVGFLIMGSALSGSARPPILSIACAASGILLLGLAVHLYFTRLPAPKHFTAKAPAEIVATYKSNASLQAYEISKAFFGDWIEVEVTLQSLSPVQDREEAIFYSKDSDDVAVNGTFEQTSMKRVRQLRPGDKMKISGRIQSAGPNLIVLENVEFAAN
jgi:hypothetical protein